MGLFTPPSSEDLLLQQASQGNRRSVERLVQTHQAMAYTVALRVVGNQQDAEEVVQDAFMKAFGALVGFKQAAKFSTWLYRIVYNTALTKKSSRSPAASDWADAPGRAGDVNQEPNEWESLRQGDRKKYISLALSRLPSDDALVLTLHYLGEKRIAEVCDIMGKKTSAIKMQLLRGRKQLEQELNGLLPLELRNLL
jgi:RNA polymerase sigma-70 factor (ECF subfamily)